MALIGYRSATGRGADATRADHARLRSLAAPSRLWADGAQPGRRGRFSSTSPTANRTAIAVVGETPFAPTESAVGPVPGSLAVARDGRVVALSGYLFDLDRLTTDDNLPPTASPAAILAAALEAIDHDDFPSLLNGFDGDYSLVCWDPRAETLTLAVSPMATRTLYWHDAAAGFWFATSLAQLFRFPDVPRRLSALAVACYTSAILLDSEESMFADVRSLRPGTVLHKTNNGLKHQVIWQADPRKRLTLSRNEDYIDAARELLDRAVERRLQAVGSMPAVSVSGGLDSSSVAATLARLRPTETIPTYTSIPTGDQYISERPFVEELAKLHPNIRPHFCGSADMASFEDDPRAFFLAGGRGMMQMTHVGWFDPLYRAIRDDNHRVVFHGMAGNLTLGYDGLFSLSDMLRDGRILRALHLMRSTTRFRQKPLWPHLRFQLGAAFPQLRRLWRRRKSQPHWLMHSAIRTEAVQDLDIERLLEQHQQDGHLSLSTDDRTVRAHFLNGRHHRHVETYTSLRAYYGFDLLDPLSDRSLVEFSMAIPGDQYVLDGRNRSLVRRALVDRLPPAILSQPLVLPQNPEWHRRLSAQKERFAADLEQFERSPMASQLLDIPRLRKILADLPADEQQAQAQAQNITYTCTLSRAIHVGRFVQWVEGGNQ